MATSSTELRTRRRGFLLAAASAGLVCVAPRLALARAATERRLVFIIQRGAADGLATLMPYADPAYEGLRRELAGDTAAARLDGSFALHPALAETARLYRSGEALFVHAVASPYRDRSHFDGQNVLETGGASPYRQKDGWLNRLVALLPHRAGDPPESAIALAPTVPMALRGAEPVGSYAPSKLPQANDDLMMRVAQLYESDAQLHPLWTSAMDARGLPMDGSGPRSPAQNGAALGTLAARFLARAGGPRIGMIETGGWDTHSAQNARLAAQLRNLDALIGGLKAGLGEHWADTVVLVATEFGRTAPANGTGGTDHGTGSLAMVLGGAVSGGRILADWPGLGPTALLDGRDLRPTASFDALAARIGCETFNLDPERCIDRLFPGMNANARSFGRPLPGGRLLRS